MRPSAFRNPRVDARLPLILACVAALAVAGGCGAEEPALPERTASAPALPPWTGPRASYTPEELELVFLGDSLGDTFQLDPVAMLVPRPDLDLRWYWPEHPDGGFRLRTNADGFRKDVPTRAERPDLRVLVAGDSHTFGLVDNGDSFPNVLERLLAEREPERSVEVLNAGANFTGPTGYCGVLRKHLDLEPDALVVTPFTGNDFWNELWLARQVAGPPVEFGDAGYREPLVAVQQRWAGPLAQGGNQAYRFKHHPEEAEEAFEDALTACLAIRGLCAREGVALLFVLVPTKVDADAGKQGEEALDEFRALLGLTPDEVALNRRLGERLAAALEAEGVACIDPTDAMRADPRPLYWTTDHHLNVEGHRFVAELLAERLPEILPDRASTALAGPSAGTGPH